MNRIGVAIVGVNGAVASTLIAGVELMKRGLAPRIGMVTETHRRADRGVDSPSCSTSRRSRSLVFARLGPAVRERATRARSTTRCSRAHVLEQVKRRARARHAVAGRLLAATYVEKLIGDRTSCDAKQPPRGDRGPRATNLEAFKQATTGSSASSWSTSRRPRRFLEVAAGAQEPARVRGRARRERRRPSRRRCVTSTSANKLGIPYCNFTPSLTNVPALERARDRAPGNPFAGMDGKTGQTLAQDGARLDVPRRASCTSTAGTRPTSSATTTAWSSTRPASNKTKVLSQDGRARLDRRLPRREPPGSHPLLQAARRLEGSLGQHRHRGLRRHPDADQGQLPLPGLGARGAARHRSRPPARRRASARASAASSGSSRSSSSRPTPARRVAGARPLQAGEAPARLGARSRDAEGAAPDQRREVARGARPVKRSGNDDLALFGRAPVLPRTRTDSGRSSRTTSGSRWRACSIAASSPARSRPRPRRCEQEFARFVGAQYASSRTAGRARSRWRLAAAGVRAGDEVIVPAYSFVATPLSVLQVGAIPVFVDVDEGSGCLDPVGDRGGGHAPHARDHAGARARLRGGHGRDPRAGARPAPPRRRGRGAGARRHVRRAPVGALGRCRRLLAPVEQEPRGGRGGPLRHQRRRPRRGGELRSATSARTCRSSERAHYDDRATARRRRARSSRRRIGSMYRGNEMMAAFARAQLAQAPGAHERDASATPSGSRGRSRELPGVTPPSSRRRGERPCTTSSACALDPERAGRGARADPAPRRDAPRARGRGARGRPLAKGAAPGADGLPEARRGPRRFPRLRRRRHRPRRINYDPARYPRTRALLDGSLVLFSQSCPLIAQDDAVVDRYIEAFERVWHHRTALAAWAERELPRSR